MILLLCSLEDEASVNIRDSLLDLEDWTTDDVGGRTVLSSGGMCMMDIPGLHIRCDGLDDELRQFLPSDPEAIVFLSKHRAKSGIPTLTVHPIGNYHDAMAGGSARTLVPSSPHLMTSLLRSLDRVAGDLDPGISFEVTHHGPSLRTPSVFIEIGSDESRWGVPELGDAIARSILDVDVVESPVAIGIGGGHYAPRFSEISLRKRISFGHMVPAYALTQDDEDELRRVVRLARDATPGAELAYLHRKSMKRSQASRMGAIAEEEGLRVVSSKDLQDL